MADIVSQQKRSEMMSGIKGKDTKPEQIIRKSLHGLGYRYRLNVKSLPGKPDLVLPKYKAVVLIHGCFWHGHDCHLFKWPKSRKDFWRNKIMGNQEKDRSVLKELKESGWRIMIVWECALRGKEKLSREKVIRQITSWLVSDEGFHEIRGSKRSNGQG